MTNTQVFRECPACGAPSSASDVLFGASLFGQPCDIRKCRTCGLVFKEWFPAPAAVGDLYRADYVHFDPSSPTGAQERHSARQKLARCRELLGGVSPEPVRLLDVGCGSGGFVTIARELGYDAEGIDPHLPTEMLRAGLRRAGPDELPAQSFDVVMLLNVAEHVPEPHPLFASVFRLLRPGGVMLLTCPYGDSLARRFHRSRWGHLALDEHVLFWTPEALTRLLRRVGFGGEIRYRIAGSPFPYGRTGGASVIRAGETGAPAKPATSARGLPIQATAWRLARRIQRHESLGNAVRSLVHATRSGDYLEYVISTRASVNGHRHR